MNSNEIHVPINDLSNSDETKMKLSDYIYTEYQELKIEIDYVKTMANRNKDGSICSIFAYIEGIRNCDTNVVCLPNGNLLNKYDLFDVLQIKANYNILNNRRRASFSKGDVLLYRVLSFENNVMKIEVDVSKYVNNKLRGINLIDINLSKCFLKLDFALKDKDVSSISKINVSELQTLPLNVGEKYSLVIEGEEEFQNIERTYIVVGKVEKLNDISIDSIIVKQIDGIETTIFSLTKNDCKMLGIKYMPGLQLFPSNMDWKQIKEEKDDVLPDVKKKKEIKETSVKENTNDIDRALYNLYYSDFIFNNNGYETKQICTVKSKIIDITYEDNSITSDSITSVTIRLEGFYHCGENKIMTPEKQEMDVEDFLASLKVITAKEFYGNIDSYTDNKRVYATFEKYENIPFRVMTQKYGTQMVDYQNICDANGRLYIELDLTKPYVEIGQTITRYIGLSNLYNISSDDFVVAWVYGILPHPEWWGLLGQK